MPTIATQTKKAKPLAKKGKSKRRNRKAKSNGGNSMVMRSAQRGIITNGELVLTDEERWSTSIGEGLTNLTFTPGESQLLRLDNLASNYDLYRVEAVQILYKPNVGTTVNGAVLLGADYDAFRVPSTQDDVLALAPVMRVPVWEEGCFTPFLDRINKQKWLYTSNVEAGDVRLKTGFVLSIWNTGPAAAGDIYVKYRVRFSSPQYGITPSDPHAITVDSGATLETNATDPIQGPSTTVEPDDPQIEGHEAWKEQSSTLAGLTRTASRDPSGLPAKSGYINVALFNTCAFNHPLQKGHRYRLYVQGRVVGFDTPGNWTMDIRAQPTAVDPGPLSRVTICYPDSTGAIVPHPNVQVVPGTWSGSFPPADGSIEPDIEANATYLFDVIGADVESVKMYLPMYLNTAGPAGGDQPVVASVVSQNFQMLHIGVTPPDQ